MSWSSCAAASAVVMVTALSGCRSAAKPNPDAGPDAAVTPVTFVGGCVNETSGTPYQSIFFFPQKKEMFIYESLGVVRVPVTVVHEAPTRVDFTFRWSEGDSPATTQKGSVSAVDGKWQFDFEAIKDSTCHPVPADSFYKILPDLGVAAGKWLDAVDHFAIVIAADSQNWVLKIKNETTFIHYRVLEHTDNSWVVASYPKTPGDTDDEVWVVSRLSLEGGILTQELDKGTLHYKLVSAAPQLKP